MCLSATKCPHHTPHPPLILLHSTNTPEQKHSTTDDFAAPLHDSEDHTDELRLEQSPGDCTEPGSNPFTDPPTHSHSHLSVRAATGWSTHSLHMAPQLQLPHITGHSCTRPIEELPDPPHLSSASEPNTVSPDSEHTDFEGGSKLSRDSNTESLRTHPHPTTFALTPHRPHQAGKHGRNGMTPEPEPTLEPIGSKHISPDPIGRAGTSTTYSSPLTGS